MLDMKKSSKPACPSHRQAGRTDIGIVLLIVGASLAIWAIIGVMGWIKNVKDARYAHPQHEYSTNDNNYREPGAYQVIY